MSILNSPACKDYLWGGTKLITDYGKRYDARVSRKRGS